MEQPKKPSATPPPVHEHEVPVNSAEQAQRAAARMTNEGGPPTPAPSEGAPWAWVWIDLEMTGLDVEKDQILEIAVVITDSKMQHKTEGPNLVIHASDEQLAAMSQVVQEMHSKSGLTQRALQSTLTVAQAERQVLDWLNSQGVPSGTSPLVGNSPYTDRCFLQRHMPALYAFLHYRTIDVSTVRMLATHWLAIPKLEDKVPHRALGDIRRCIKELEYYRDCVFKPQK